MTNVTASDVGPGTKQESLTVTDLAAYLLEDDTGALWLAVGSAPEGAPGEAAPHRPTLPAGVVVYGTKMSHLTEDGEWDADGSEDPERPPAMTVPAPSPGADASGGFSAFLLPQPLAAAVRAVRRR